MRDNSPKNYPEATTPRADNPPPTPQKDRRTLDGEAGQDRSFTLNREGGDHGAFGRQRRSVEVTEAQDCDPGDGRTCTYTEASGTFWCPTCLVFGVL